MTGDIVEERATDHVVLIDRRKDVLKLSQGEYVAVGPLGTVFEAGSAVIEQVYLYGNSNRAYLLAVVVPDKIALTAALGKNPAEDDKMAFKLYSEYPTKTLYYVTRILGTKKIRKNVKKLKFYV